MTRRLWDATQERQFSLQVIFFKMGDGQQFSLRWNNYLSHITCAFDSLRTDQDFVDVTLSCEGKKIRAHKMLLSACSTYFRDLFKENPCQHPVIIFRNVKFDDLSALVDFMYQGEVNVLQDQLSSFLTTAELLAVQGLSDGTDRDSLSDMKECEIPDSPPLATEPEVQLGSSHLLKQLSGGGNGNSVSSPVSFFPVEQSSNSPPSSKRRKWGSGASGSGTGTKNVTSSSADKDNVVPERERRRATQASKPAKSSIPPVEIIPVVPTLKVEMPDYDPQDQDGSSCSYSDSNQGMPSGDALSAMSQLLSHGNASTSDGKQDHSEMYSTDSRDGTLQHSADSLSAADISQMLAKPGPSGENQSQDSLQVAFQHRNHGVMYRNATVTKIPLRFECVECGKKFNHLSSLNKHKQVHSGNTTCPLCYKVLNRMIALKKHMKTRHNCE